MRQARKTRYSNGSGSRPGSLIGAKRTPSLSHRTKRTHNFRSPFHRGRCPLCPQSSASDWRLQSHGTIAAAVISPAPGKIAVARKEGGCCPTAVPFATRCPCACGRFCRAVCAVRRRASLPRRVYVFTAY
eukprot:scaffold33523_cov112-Isochrysis_galbana.AAC.9